MMITCLVLLSFCSFKVLCEGPNTGTQDGDSWPMERKAPSGTRDDGVTNGNHIQTFTANKYKLKNPRWVPGEWSQCSVTCGDGLRSLKEVCKYEMLQSVLATVSSEKCPGSPNMYLTLCRLPPCSNRGTKQSEQSFSSEKYEMPSIWRQQKNSIHHAVGNPWKKVLNNTYHPQYSSFIPKLPDNFRIAEDIVAGDSFFVSLAEGLRQLRTSLDPSEKSLRQVCKEYAQHEMQNNQTWLRRALDNQSMSLGQYVSQIEFTGTDVKHVPVVYLQIQGRGEIEGRIICIVYNIKLHVIQEYKHKGNVIWKNQIIDEDGSRFADNVNYGDENTVHVLYRNSSHFQPVLRIEEVRHREKRSSDFSDYDDEISSEEYLIQTIKSTDSEEEKLMKIKNIFRKNTELNINFQDSSGDTALHIATRRKELNVIKFLVKNGANINIENKRNRSPINIGKKLNREDIVDALEGKPEAEEPPDSLQEQDTQEDDETFNRRQGTSGIKGQLYEIELLMVHLLQGIKKTEEKAIHGFSLATNVDEAGDIDDVVFQWQYDGQDKMKRKKTIFLQAKHRESAEKDKVSLEKLFSVSDKSDYSLNKYFKSYREIKKQFALKTADRIFGEHFEDVEFIFYTNALSTFDENDENVKKEYARVDDILNFDGDNYYFKLTLHGKDKQIIEQFFQSSSDCRKLAKQLLESIFSGKVIDVDKGVVKMYHYSLAQEVFEKIKKGEAKFRSSFLDDDYNSQFKVAFLEEMQKREEFKGMLMEEIKLDLSGRNIKIPSNFGTLKEKHPKPPLPDDVVSKDDINEFLGKLKIFVAQPNEAGIGDYIKSKIQSIYAVDQNDVDAVFADVRNKVEKWWIEGRNYLKENNKFFQESAKVSIWFDVKKPVVLFTGRKKELADLHKNIQSSSKRVTVISQTTSISGLGGVGKTELSRQYIQEYSHNFDNNVIWINAESEITLTESFERLAKVKLKIPTKDADGKNKDIQSIVDEVYAFFKKRKSIFVFDNAEKNGYLNTFLPLRVDGNIPHILITSRNREWETGMKVIDLNELEENDAINFVKKGLNIKDSSQDESIRSLVQKLQCFPLAIQQAIAYIQDQKVTGEFGVIDYLQEYEKKTKDLLDSEIFRGIDNDYSRTTFTTWKITIDKIANDKDYGQLALNIMDVISFFAPQNIHRAMFSHLTSEDEGRLKSAVRLLVKYSMLNGEDMQSILNIHRLVQEVTRLELKGKGDEEQKLHVALSLVKDNLEKENIDHAVSAWNHVHEHANLVKTYSELPSNIISKLDEYGRYKEAFLFGIEALPLMEGTLETDHIDILSTKNSIALALYSQGKYDEALELFEYVLEKRKLILGPNHHATLTTMNSIANTLDNQGKHDQSLDVYQKVYERRLAIAGPNDIETLKVQDNMALTLFNKGQYKDAVNIYRQIYDKIKEILGPEDPATLKAGNNMALVLENVGKLEESLNMYNEIYEIQCKVFGEKHPLTLKTINNIVAVLGKQGKPIEEQLRLLEEAYEGQKHVLGLKHPDTLLTMLNMGITLGQLQRYEEAVHVLKEVYGLRKEVLGENHLLTQSTKHSTAVVLHLDGKLDEALDLYQKVYEVQKNNFGDLHPHTLLTRNNMLEIIVDRGEYEIALEIYRDIYEKRKEKLGEAHYDTMTTRNDVGKVLEKQGKYDEALEVFQDVYAKRKENLGETHPDTRSTKETIDRIYQHQLSLREREVGEMSPKECLGSGSHARRKRDVERECLISWEDVDEFNIDETGKRDVGRIKIDSGMYLNYIKGLSEEKRNQLIGLAGHVEVTGKFQGFIYELIRNKKIMTHLERAGIISGAVMHGMIGKNIMSDFLNENYKGVAINLGFIANGPILGKLAESVSAKGAQFALQGRLMLGASLRAAAPFLTRGTSAFIVYDLINQIKEYKSGTQEAFVGIVGDSIYLGLDVAEIGIEIAEAFEVLQGVSSVTGPIGATIGAVVFVGTEIYMAAKRVDAIDDIIHLNGKERFVEGLRAFIGMKPEQYIEELMEEKQVGNHLVNKGLEYLKQHSDFSRYVFSSGKSFVQSCQKAPHKTSECNGVLEGRCSSTSTDTQVADQCTTKFQVTLDNTVLLDKKTTNLKWRRGRPENPEDGEFFCLPQGDYEQVPSRGSYLCKEAIGVADLSTNKTGNFCVISLGEGRDYAKGFDEYPNIFIVNNGVKRYYGGYKNDMFILLGNSVKGYFSGHIGINTLDLTSFAPEEESIDVKLHLGRIKAYQNNSFGISGMSKILGRKDKGDNFFITCSGANSVKFLDGQGGSERVVDHLTIYEKDCEYEIQMVVRPFTVIENRALKGRFYYTVPRAFGSSEINFFDTSKDLNLNNTFIFDYEPFEIQNIDVRTKNILNKTSQAISFSFSIMTDKEFNITISNAFNPTYMLGTNTVIKVGDKSNLYVLQNTKDSADEIIRRYFDLAKRTNRISYFINLLSSNESVAIGSGDYEVIRNNPFHKSHLAGNKDQNVYVIDYGKTVYGSHNLPLPEVVIYNLGVEDSLDTIDLRKTAEQAKYFFSRNNSFELQIFASGHDLILQTTVTEHKPATNKIANHFQTHEYFTCRLKDGISWYPKTHVIVNNVPMEIKVINNKWRLKPIPLVFGNDKNIIFVTNKDIVENMEIVTPKRAGNYKFVRFHGTDLMITNAFDNNIAEHDLCTIVFYNFYVTPEMNTVSVRFADKEIMLKEEQEHINKAKDINQIVRESKTQVYDKVFFPIKR